MNCSIFAAAVPNIVIPLPTAAAWTLGVAGAVIGLLLAAVAWFLKRALADNDRAHRDLGTRIDRVDAKVERVDAKVERVDAKVERVASDLATVRASVGRIEGYLLGRGPAPR